MEKSFSRKGATALRKQLGTGQRFAPLRLGARDLRSIGFFLRQPYLRLGSLVMLVVVTQFILCPSEVAAIPLSEYQQNIQRAIGSLETITQFDDADFERQLDDVTNSVRTALPEHQTIELDGAVYNVDNTWVHKALDELKQSEDRSEKLAHLLDRLRALEQRVAERKAPAGQLAETKQQAKSRLENILARPEYATSARDPNALMRLLQDFARWLQQFLPKRRSMDPGRINLLAFIARVVVMALAALLIGYVVKTVLVWFLGRSPRTRKEKKREPRIVLGERLEPEATASGLLSEAEALARSGDLRSAIRKAYIALLVELGDRKIISLAHHKTNRDYLNSLRSLPQLHSRMHGLTNSFERHWYGFVTATPNDWQDFRAGYLAALQSGN